MNDQTTIGPARVQNNERDRRLFLQAGVAAVAGYGMTRPSRADEIEDASRTQSSSEASPNDKMVIGIMGVNGRGTAIAKGMLANGNVQIAYICDVDERAAGRVTQFVGEDQSEAPKSVADFRRILDDQRVDALICAAPNHWHAPATIMACNAGKHVYVEKPCSYTPAEGEMAVAAARNNDRIVQMGTQRRSWPGIIEAIDKIHAGAIGKTLYARCWYNNRRSSIGVGKPAAVPSWLDWRMWQGPAPDRPFKDNLVHYNWHWNWHWGNGELGNNGIHGLDVARWALDVTYPSRVTAGGGTYRHEDDQETPDTMMVTYDFPEKKSITWEGLSWSPNGIHNSRFGISIHGTEGAMVLPGDGYTQYDMNDQEVASGSGAAGDSDHFADFIAAVRENRRPNADIEIAHQSTLLCHLGNIAYRTSSVLNTNSDDGHIINHPAAVALWSREYATGWEPAV